MRNSSIIVIIFVFLTATACSDFLEEENKANVVANEYYTTEEGYESLINATYASLRSIYGEQPFIFVAGTDLFVEGRDSQPEGISEYRNLSPDDQYVEDFYRAAYASIQLTNTALYYNDITEPTSTLDTRRGEVKFLRAFYYFLLAQQFGGVAIVDARINEPVIEFDRNSAEEVYDFIIMEMEEALDLVPETAEERGRVDKRAIRHFLAKAYLTRGYESFGTADDFTQAAQYADAAINGQPLNLSFEELFFPGNEENEEILFSVQYDPVSVLNPREDGHFQNFHYGPYFGGEGVLYSYPYRSYQLCPTLYLFDVFTENDARFNATFMIQNYFYRDAQNNLINSYYDYYNQADNRGDLYVGTYFAPKWALDDTTAWRAEDPEHRSVTTIIPYSPAWQASPQTTFDNATPAIKKFDDPNAAFSDDGNSTRDIFLARLGETYLIAAEAYLQAGNAALAAERINEVRRRAAKPGQESEMMITAADVDIDFILDERARELAGEYHRWFDLKRTGTLAERTQMYNRDIQDWFNSGINPFMGADGELKILRPIPQDALDLNEADFAQNPGY